MKAFLVNLLLALSLALCGFNAYQWYREAKLHGKLAGLGEEVFKKSGEIQSLQQNVKINLEEIKRLEGIREGLGSTIKSNKVMITQLEEQSEKFRRDAQIQAAKAAQVEQYKVAFEKANENLKKQNEIISGLNDRLKQLAEDRNEAVTRLNKLAEEYKSLGDDYQKVTGLYTNLVAQVQAANEKNKR